MANIEPLTSQLFLHKHKENLKLNFVPTTILYPTADSATAIQINKADGTTNILNIDTANGRVGMGITAPTVQLHTFVPAASANSNYILIENGATNQQAALEWKTATTNADWVAYIPVSSTDLRLYRGADLITFQAVGNVGIGTNNPGQLLDIQKNQHASTMVRITNTDTTDTGSRARFQTVSGTVIGGLQSITGSGVWVGSESSDTLFLMTSGGNVVTILSSGNTGIGMSPTVQFELSGSVGQKATGTTWSNPSDERLKDNIILADLQQCYDDIKSLPLKRYTLRDDCFTIEQAPDRSMSGFIAQDVQKILPKAVNIIPFTKVKQLDGTQEVINDCLNLDVTQIYMQAIGALQLLIQKVEALELKVGI